MNRDKKTTSVMLLLVVFVLTVSLSCRVVLFDEEEPTATNTEEVLPSDTAPPPPTAEPPTEPPPTEEPPTLEPTEETPGIINPNASDPGDIYYAEPFNDLDNWMMQLVKGNEEGVRYQAFDNRLRVQIDSQQTWMYYFFQGGDFTDIRVDIQVENRASNTNFVGIICRYNPDGWYEVNILNTGEYYIYYISTVGGDFDLDLMYEKGTYDIRTGQKINDYIVICKGETLTVVINSIEQVAFPLRTGDYPFMPSGQVGLSVSTTNIIPVAVDFLKFVLSVP